MTTNNDLYEARDAGRVIWSSCYVDCEKTKLAVVESYGDVVVVCDNCGAVQYTGTPGGNQ